MLLCFAITPASAAPAYCAGKVLSVLTYADGTVMILPEFRKDWTAICNVNSDRQGVSPTTCITWLAAATRAASKDPAGNVGLVYPEVPSCAAVATHHSTPAPVYLWFY
jgi:hypothetical protein